MSLTARLEALKANGAGLEPSSGSATSQSIVSPRHRQSAKDPYADLKRAVHTRLLEKLGPQLYDVRLTESELSQRVRAALQEVMADEQTPIPASERVQLEQQIADDILGFGPIEPFLRDVTVTEIMVNGPHQVYLERSGKIVPANAQFADDAHLRRVIDKIVARVGRRVDEGSPMVDARLPDGSRVNAIIPPLAIDGPALTIRKFAAEPFTDEDLISFGTMTREAAEFLNACVRGSLNILVSGGTGSGKTTFLNVLSAYIPETERIVTIEDAAELQLHQEHVIRLEARPPNIEGRGEIRIRDLVKNSLRMRPDRIVVGEIRDDAALDMLQAMNTGHDGSICTVHANSPRDTLSRVETMVLLGGVDLPMRAIREQVASAIDLVVQQARLKDGSRKVTHISEVVGMEGDIITMQDLFVLDMHAGYDDDGRFRGGLVSTGLRPRFLERLRDRNVNVDTRIFARPMAVAGGRR